MRGCAKSSFRKGPQLFSSAQTTRSEGIRQLCMWAFDDESLSKWKIFDLLFTSSDCYWVLDCGCLLGEDLPGRRMVYHFWTTMKYPRGESFWLLSDTFRPALLCSRQEAKLWSPILRPRPAKGSLKRSFPRMSARTSRAIHPSMGSRRISDHAPRSRLGGLAE